MGEINGFWVVDLCWDGQEWFLNFLPKFDGRVRVVARYLPIKRYDANPQRPQSLVENEFRIWYSISILFYVQRSPQNIIFQKKRGRFVREDKHKHTNMHSVQPIPLAFSFSTRTQF